jgi:hypothetical protein
MHSAFRECKQTLDHVVKVAQKPSGSGSSSWKLCVFSFALRLRRALTSQRSPRLFPTANSQLVFRLRPAGCISAVNASNKSYDNAPSRLFRLWSETLPTFSLFPSVPHSHHRCLGL